MVHSSLSSFAIVSLSVAASLLETFPYHPFNGPFLSLIFRRRLPERGSESFRDFSISSFQWSIPLSHLSPRLPERGSESFRGFSIRLILSRRWPLDLSLIFRRRLPERGSESFRDFSISSFQWSIPLSAIWQRFGWYGKVSKRLAATLRETTAKDERVF